MGLICLVEEPGGRETVILWKTLPERFSKFWEVCFTAFDRDMIYSTSPGICKVSQASPSSKGLLFETCKGSRRYVLETVPFDNILLPSHVWFVPTPGISDAVITYLWYDD